MRLKDKIVLISGGAATVSRFVDVGARVTVCDLQTERSEALAAALGARAYFVRLDVTSDRSWGEAVAVAQAGADRSPLWSTAGTSSLNQPSPATGR